MDGELVTLQAGEFITGRKEASKDLRFKSVMWDRKLDVLENLQIVNRRATKRYSVISVLNWNTYQGTEDGEEQASEQVMNKSRTSDEQVMNTDKNVKNDKNVKKKSNTSHIDFISSLKENPSYNHIDIDHELGKMKPWLLLPKNKGRRLTQTFILKWLNRIDKPIYIPVKEELKSEPAMIKCKFCLKVYSTMEEHKC